jgi:hypothetical protein
MAGGRSIAASSRARRLGVPAHNNAGNPRDLEGRLRVIAAERQRDEGDDVCECLLV